METYLILIARERGEREPGNEFCAWFPPMNLLSFVPKMWDTWSIDSSPGKTKISHVQIVNGTSSFKKISTQRERGL
jgi:hypothetical protein